MSKFRTSRIVLRSTALLVLAVMAVGCKGKGTKNDLVAAAQFGIFYGGQVQERSEIPFELDRAKQSQGIRLDFAKPPQSDIRVTWELAMPSARRGARGKDAGAERIVQVGETVARAGQRRLDVALPFKPGDPLGVWHVRVNAGDTLVIDRDFTVYDRQKRARDSDAGVAFPEYE